MTRPALEAGQEQAGRRELQGTLSTPVCALSRGCASADSSCIHINLLMPQEGLINHIEN